MTIQHFEDLESWKKGKSLAISIYNKTKSMTDIDFKRQLQRATISITNNIAEGFERQGDKELRRFCFIAKGSCGEVRSMLYLGLELGYIARKDFEELYEQTIEISKILSGFIKRLNQ